jgi:hypothetical protein
MAFAASLCFTNLALEGLPGDVRQTNLVWRVTRDKCLVCGFVICFVTVRKMVVVLKFQSEIGHRRSNTLTAHTSSSDADSALNFTPASLIFVVTGPVPSFVISDMNTTQALSGLLFGSSRAVTFSALITSRSFFFSANVFCLSVKTFRFGAGFFLAATFLFFGAGFFFAAAFFFFGSFPLGFAAAFAFGFAVFVAFVRLAVLAFTASVARARTKKRVGDVRMP